MVGQGVGHREQRRRAHTHTHTEKQGERGDSTVAKVDSWGVGELFRKAP